MNDFIELKCQQKTNSKKFGICDDVPPPSFKAYIDIDNGQNWIAVVDNQENHDVTFTAIDNCVDLRSRNGKMMKRCDGVLSYESSIIYVELKHRSDSKNRWIKDGELQLKSTIKYFESQHDLSRYQIKKAYIANKKKPRLMISHRDRMRKFEKETGYILRIHNRIDLSGYEINL